MPWVSLNAEEKVPEVNRPRIGVALSGGGARGCAHVGVLKVLEELRIPVDFIAGTSMGAVVGGLYATGRSAAEVEEILSTMDWEAMAEDEEPRRDRVFHRKEDDQRFIMNFEVGLDGFVLPSGLRSGQRFTFELRRYTLDVAHVSNFRALPIPFTAVAVDLETGDTVLMDHGSLSKAIRASMSIPGVFTPVEIDGRLLVDGGIVENLPIDVVREMGADIVIAVDVGDQLVSRDDLGSILAVTSQAMTISSSRAATEQLSRADIVLKPDVGDRGALAFGDITAIVADGEEEAMDFATKLRELSLSESDFLRYLELRRPSQGPELRTVGIEVKGLERVDERIVRRRLRTEIGAPLSLDTLREDLGRVYGLGDFSFVDFEVVPQADGWLVQIVVEEKRGGPFFLRSALNLDLDENQKIKTSFVLNITAMRLNALGGEWRTDLKFGSAQDLKSEFYQPLDFAGRWFLAGRLGVHREIFSVFGEEQTFELEQITSFAAVQLGFSLGNNGEFRFGPYTARLEQSQKAGEGITGLDSSVDVAGLEGFVSIDRLNSVYFPRRGQLGTFTVSLAMPEMGSEDRYGLTTLNHVGVASQGRHSFLAWLELGTAIDDDPPPYAQFFGGGLFSFSGYKRGELQGSSYGVFRPTYIFRLGDLPTVLGKGIYLAGWLEVGNYWSSLDEVSLHDLRNSATLSLGAETILGPAYLGVGFREDGDPRLYLSVGPSFTTRPR